MTVATLCLPSRIERYARLGLFTDRERADEAFRRQSRIAWKRERLTADREFRAMVRVNREHDRIKARRATLYQRHQILLSQRYRAIRDRVASTMKPAGKSEEARRQFGFALNDALSLDPEWRLFSARHQRFDERLDAIRKRRNLLQIQAGCLLIDDRATRRLKIKDYLGVKQG